MTKEISTDVREGLPSASSAEKFVSCAGSWQAEQGLPPLPAAAVTLSGTNIHAATESHDFEGVDETEAEIATRLLAMEKAAVNDFCRDHGIDVVPERHAEQRLWIRDRKTLDLIASAQLDVFYIHEAAALVIDFKSGFKKATASDQNWQLLTQAICIRHEYPQVKTFFVAIAASRLGSSFDMAQYSAEDVDAGEKELHHAIWRSKQPNAPRTPGTWCQYCKANGNCAEAAAYSSIVLIGKELKEWSKLGILENVQKMTPAQMAHVYVRSKVANMIFDAVESRLKVMPEAELNAIGLGLKTGAERRSVTNYALARAALKTAISDTEIDDCVTLGVAKAQKAIKIKKGIKDDAAKIFTNALLEPVLITSQNKPSLEILT